MTPETRAPRLFLLTDPENRTPAAARACVSQFRLKSNARSEASRLIDMQQQGGRRAAQPRQPPRRPPHPYPSPRQHAIMASHHRNVAIITMASRRLPLATTSSPGHRRHRRHQGHHHVTIIAMPYHNHHYHHCSNSCAESRDENSDRYPSV